MDELDQIPADARCLACDRSADQIDTAWPPTGSKFVPAGTGKVLCYECFVTMPKGNGHDPEKARQNRMARVGLAYRDLDTPES